METPSMEEFSPGDGDLLSTCWCIRDMKNPCNKFCTPTVTLSSKEYMAGSLNGFYNRETRSRLKYDRWFKEATFVGE